MSEARSVFYILPYNHSIKSSASNFQSLASSLAGYLNCMLIPLFQLTPAAGS